MRLVSVIDSAARKAGFLERERDFVTNFPGLGVAISQRINLKSSRGTWRPLEDVTLDTNDLTPPDKQVRFASEGSSFMVSGEARASPG